MKYFSSILFLVFWKMAAFAQPGCTDPQAMNYDLQATENDGSCTYAPTNYIPTQIALLDATLEESSGLAFFNNMLWTHEDGGNLPRVYQLDTLTGAILQQTTILLANNIDWEDLAENDESLYIGDFGNNDGDRTDLRILRINKASFLAGQTIPDYISFTYSDQTDFTPAHNANNYDCEAFFFWNDSLHLFSKNWVDFKTRHYVLPATPGLHVAQLRDSFDVQGQITGAAITFDGRAALLGYNVSTGATFIWLLFDYPGTRFFDGNKRKISLGTALATSQPEGIVFRHDGFGYISSERFSALPPRLMSFDIDQWTADPVDATSVSATGGRFKVAPNPFSDALTIEFLENIPEDFALELSDEKGVILKTIKRNAAASGEYFQLPLAGNELPSGNYWLTLRTENGGYSLLVSRR
ncbi:MAG: T9SS type A sorting domain-containing protein [Saprospiraceae bacterium]|nr:MAG: T9SS type A sorting domain-containing protein [Saprospiraceae bacterium]